MLADERFDLFLGNHGGAAGVDHQRDRLCHTNGIRHLHFASVGEAGGHDVLGHIAHGIGGRAIDLAGILAGERAAAVVGGATIRVDNDFTAGETAVAVRAADDKSAGGVHQKARLGGDHIRRQNRPDNLFDHGFAQRRMIDIFAVLG